MWYRFQLLIHLHARFRFPREDTATELQELEVLKDAGNSICLALSVDLSLYVSMIHSAIAETIEERHSVVSSLRVWDQD